MRVTPGSKSNSEVKPVDMEETASTTAVPEGETRLAAETFEDSPGHRNFRTCRRATLIGRSAPLHRPKTLSAV